VTECILTLSTIHTHGKHRRCGGRRDKTQEYWFLQISWRNTTNSAKIEFLVNSHLLVYVPSGTATREVIRGHTLNRYGDDTWR